MMKVITSLQNYDALKVITAAEYNNYEIELDLRPSLFWIVLYLVEFVFLDSKLESPCFQKIQQTEDHFSSPSAFCPISFAST